MQKIAITVAGGSGTRIGEALPKQFIILDKLPVLAYSLLAFYNYDNTIRQVVALPETFIPYWQELVLEYNIDVPHEVVSGGRERFFSVKNALDTLQEQEALVAIHDAARPFISYEYISSLFEHAAQHGSALPVLPLKDSIRRLEKGSSFPADRTIYNIVQTPQVFRLSELIEAYKQTYSAAFTDDASVMEGAGYAVNLAAGSDHAFKITTPFDLDMARLLAPQWQAAE